MDANNRKTKIHISHLKKNFDTLEVLKDISTDIYEGEVVVIIGPPEVVNPLFSDA